jgi:energy-coupling factor transporter ATP-binding protein EcfA2
VQPAADGPASSIVRVCSQPGLLLGDDWSAAAAAAAQRGATTAVIGPRGAGKSTFVKWAVNRLLSNNKSVFILDVDPGQTDTFLPCCLAVSRVTQPLLAPPHALHLKPFSVHFYGHTSPAVDIDAYCRAVAAAAASARAAAAAEGAPLVVNTLGWVKGIGWGLTCFALAASRASVIVNMRVAVSSSSSSANSSNAELGDAALLAEVGPSFPCPPIPWHSITVRDVIAPFASALKGSMTPAATRALQLHSYLHPTQLISRPFSSMCALRPAAAAAQRERCARYMCTPGHDVQRSFMLYAVVGTVVALLRSELLHNVMQQQQQQQQQQHQPLLPFEVCRPFAPAAGAGAGQSEGAYGVTDRVPPDAQARTPNPQPPTPNPQPPTPNPQPPTPNP